MKEIEEKKQNKMLKFLKENKRWFLSIIALILFIFILEDVLEQEIYRFDETIYSFISKGISDNMSQIAKIITTMGSVYVIIPVTIISIIYFWKKRESKYIVINLAIIFASNQILKRIIARPRPDEFRIVEETGYSFPSGHSMISMAFYGLFIYLIYKKINNKYLKWTLIILLSILIILIGVSRIYLGVHYASDVCAGFLLSIAYIIAFTHFISKEDKNKIELS